MRSSPTPRAGLGCHVRDVFRIFDTRLALMLAEDDPEFENWDQDATAIQDDYAGQEAFTVETLSRYLVHDPVHHLWDVEA